MAKEITSCGSTKTNTISKPIPHESFSTISSWHTWFKLESGSKVAKKSDIFFLLSSEPKIGMM